MILRLIFFSISITSLLALNRTISVCDVDQPDWNVENVTFDCELEKIPDLPRFFPKMKFLKIPDCKATRVRWQDVFSDTLVLADLSNCPIECNCENVWMLSDFQTIRKPTKMEKCLPWCAHSQLILNSTKITLKTGENVTISVKVQGPILPANSSRPYFTWAFKQGSHAHVETINDYELRLEVTNVSEADMGIIGVRCWHCVDYLSTQLELQVETPLRAEFAETFQPDTELLVLHGYPIDNLTLTVYNEEENITENQILDLSTDSVFFNNLVVRPEKRKVFFQRTFKIFPKDILESDHVSGNVSFTVCGPLNCQQLANSLKHLANQKEIEIRNVGIGRTSWTKVMLIGVFFIGVLVVLAYSMLRYKANILHFYEKKSLRKRIWNEEIRTRRDSMETEQTLLRLEERSSLTSDYSNQIIPFIAIGNISIHEIIGKGAFGVVYCGSWEQTGDRSVAVKSLAEADDVIEKEARVLARLEHPNVVRLYGMTRDRNNLLLVLERMRLGDLQTYLRLRTPKVSEYTQFPPALTRPELKKIIRDIVNGVNYLTHQQIVHRDLAARNCLVDGDPDQQSTCAAQRPNITIKISDFGMSRQLFGSTDYYRMTNHSLLPVRWLPPEAINDQKFSHMSDIWSLGVTMWEVFSYGKVPFADLSTHEVVSYAMAGMRPPRPKGCPDDFHELMMKCWQIEPEKRITAEQILMEPCMYKSNENAPEMPTSETTETMQTILTEVSDPEPEPEPQPDPTPSPPKTTFTSGFSFQPFDTSSSYTVAPYDPSDFLPNNFISEIPSFNGDIIPLSILGPSYNPQRNTVND